MKIYQKFALLLFIFASIGACQDIKPDNSTTIATIRTQPNLTFKVIPAPNNTFGYAIFKDGKAFIHQDNIPAIGGIEGFKTAAQAEKVAQFVIEKMQKNDGLPAVTSQELAQLGAL
jgi:Domain of unknown function (DUF4907)